MSTLVILESKSKIPKVQKFLGSEYVVTASYGHIRDLPHKELSIDVDNNFSPNYQISDDKKQVVKTIKQLYKSLGKNPKVLLACDYDREGESIAWHLSEILKLKKTERKRMLFTEITQKAITHSVKQASDLDMDMVYAQQARRLLDRLIGYIITPLLWKHIQSSYKKDNSLSAGRVQSVVLKLIIEREQEIKKFNSVSNFKLCGNFLETLGNEFLADLNKELKTKEDALKLLNLCKQSKFKIHDVEKKTTTRKPQQPFITSTLQQEASNKFKMSPKTTMKCAQVLYENSYITYMRTDSVMLSDEAKQKIKSFIETNYGKEYYENNTYKNKNSNCQEAHEAIRPCKMTIVDIADDSNMSPNDIKLYKLIWKRTIASQMKNAKVELTNAIIKGDKLPKEYYFSNKTEKILFDGFLKVYHYQETNEPNESNKIEINNPNVVLKKDDSVSYKHIKGQEKFSKPSHSRYTEASLIKKLDELGIGRPSTYANMVSIVQDRKYVEKKDIESINKYGVVLELVKQTIKEKSVDIKCGGEKQKMVPTDIGEIVNGFMNTHFSAIIDYKYTSIIETELDKISKGELDWTQFLKKIYTDLYANSDILMNQSLEKNKHKRLLGKCPKTKHDILCYIGKYGPVIQCNNKFSPLGDFKLDSITLVQAIELLKYPQSLGKYNKKEIVIKKGKFGIYIVYDKKNYSIVNSEIDTTLEEAIRIIEKSISSNQENSTIKKINDSITIKKGPYGPYISYKKNNKFINVKIFGKVPEELNEAECLDLISKKYNKSKK
jgi:DNA topoisomerase I